MPTWTYPPTLPSPRLHVQLAASVTTRRQAKLISMSCWNITKRPSSQWPARRPPKQLALVWVSDSPRSNGNATFCHLSYLEITYFRVFELSKILKTISMKIYFCTKWSRTCCSRNDGTNFCTFIFFKKLWWNYFLMSVMGKDRIHFSSEKKKHPFTPSLTGKTYRRQKIW